MHRLLRAGQVAARILPTRPAPFSRARLRRRSEYGLLSHKHAAHAQVRTWHDSDNRGGATTSAVLWGNNRSAKRVDRMTRPRSRADSGSAAQRLTFSHGQNPKRTVESPSINCASSEGLAYGQVNSQWRLILLGLRLSISTRPITAAEMTARTSVVSKTVSDSRSNFPRGALLKFAFLNSAPRLAR